MLSHIQKAKKRLSEAQVSLDDLLQQHGHTVEYLSLQWERQRKAQMDVISATARQKRERMAELLEMEEELIETREKLRRLKLKRVRARTGREKRDLLNIPKSLGLLEAQIHAAAAELGTQEFLELTGMSDDRAKPLLALQVAKGKLYEARVGVIEARRRAERTTGTTSQTQLNQIKSQKNKILQKKYRSHHRRVQAYNERFTPSPLIPDPSLADVERMDLSDPFWSGGSTLSHPEEPWASDLPTRDGIQAFLAHRSSKEELCRIAREARQLTQWALDYQSKIDSVRPQVDEGMSDSNQTCSSLHLGLSKVARQLWYKWGSDLIHVIRSTAIFLPSVGRLTYNQKLIKEWKELMEVQFGHWDQLLARLTVVEVHAVVEVERDMVAEGEAQAEEDELIPPENFDLEQEDDTL
ncbi:hypothetical protein DFH28DRAFT_909133 [Melampsora americana]|nr:hypothetical protein DFH28DRAFT_909133 [Melampsora americana]